MKARLEFVLPQEAEEHQRALEGARYYSLLRHLDEHLRQRLKYGDLAPAVQEELEHVRSLIREEGVDLDA